MVEPTKIWLIQPNIFLSVPRQCTSTSIKRNYGLFSQVWADSTTVQISPPHLPYSSDLAPCDFGLFAEIKKKTKKVKRSSIFENRS